MCDDLCSSGTFYHSLYITLFFFKTFFLYYHIRFNTWIARQNFGSNDWVDYMLLNTHSFIETIYHKWLIMILDVKAASDQVVFFSDIRLTTKRNRLRQCRPTKSQRFIASFLRIFSFSQGSVAPQLYPLFVLFGCEVTFQV